MKTQHNPRFLAALCLLALWLASACANKNNVAENEQVDGYAETAEGEAGSTESTDATTTTESSEAELFGDASNPAPTAESTAQADPAMDSLFDPSNQDPNASSEPNFDDLAGKSADGTAATDSSATAASSPLPTETPAPVTSDLSPSASADPLLAGSADSTALTDPASSTDAQAFSSDSSFSKKSYSGAVVPNIPDRAVTRKGKSLNRYYFLRQGDTSKSVSSLLYGDAGHSADLKKWNKGRWIPGKVVYYASPVQPDDAQMVSFYDERGLAPEQHTVGKGETMSTIAKKTLGSVSSWKELAVVNGLTRPDALKRGQTIKVFSNLNASSAQNAVDTAAAQFSPPAQEPIAAQPPTQDPSVGANSAPDMAAIPPVQDPIAEDLNKPKKKPRKEGLNLARLISQNSFALAMGLGIGLLAIALMMVNKRKKGGGIEDFNEDAFAAPGKKKRR